MAYKSKFTGAQIDEYLTIVQNQQTNPGSILDNVTEEQILAKLTETGILSKLTGQGIINKINTVATNIVFTKYVDAQAGGGNSQQS